jgi:hypothetical protein
MNVHVNFTQSHLKVTSHVHLFISTPLATIRFHNWGVFCVVLQHFLKSSPIPPQYGSLHGLCMDGEEFDDTWMFTQACQKTSTKCCLHISHLSTILGVFLANSMVFGMWSNLSIYILRTTPKLPAIHLRSLSLRLWCFRDCVNEMLSPFDIFATLWLYMVESEAFKGYMDNYQMMCEIMGLGF